MQHKTTAMLSPFSYHPWEEHRQTEELRHLPRREGDRETSDAGDRREEPGQRDGQYTVRDTGDRGRDGVFRRIERAQE